MTSDQVVADTRLWLEKAVIGLNLCPFAKAVYIKNQVRFRVSEAITVEQLAIDYIEELELLISSDPEKVETTLLIHPKVLQRFLDFNDFLAIAEVIIEDRQLTGELQVASFHPRFQFEGTAVNDMENFTNRSPYPTLHLLREASIDRAVATFPDTEQIYQKNIETVTQLGLAGWKALLSDQP
ncbi:DUF1415 domain-containing protein [Neisseriaceae bacterium TC5R-5]|nr:DUF1415 domain-containing protein [Neisseriaceae bacterium TC5R-5]